MQTDLIYYLNTTILRASTGLIYTVKDVAPNNFGDLLDSTSLVIWAGESRNTIFQDPAVNWAFRALHDQLHLKTLIGFTPREEIELGRIQANMFQSEIIADIVYCEVAGQAEYYLKTGNFVKDQVAFTEAYLGL